MKVVDKIKIRYFQSIKDQTIVKLEEVNVFSDALLSSYTETLTIAGGGQVKKVKDSKKEAFANKVNDFDKKEFNNFKTIFDLIENLIK